MCPKSFLNVKDKWIPEVRHYTYNVPVILVGMKNDLYNDEKKIQKLSEMNELPISYEMGVDMAKQVGAICYIDCSAKTQSNLKDLFKLVVIACCLDEEKIKKNEKNCSIQ